MKGRLDPVARERMVAEAREVQARLRNDPVETARVEEVVRTIEECGPFVDDDGPADPSP